MTIEHLYLFGFIFSFWDPKPCVTLITFSTEDTGRRNRVRNGNGSRLRIVTISPCWTWNRRPHDTTLEQIL